MTAEYFRFILPGIDDRQERRGNTFTDEIARAVYECLFETSQISAVDYRSFTGRQQQEHLLGILQSQNDSTSKPDGRNPISIVRKNTPAELGLELATIDFSPLGDSPAPTGRLLTTTTDPFGKPRETDELPVIRLLSALCNQTTPHMVQVCCRQLSEDPPRIAATMRVAIFDPEVGWKTDIDYAAHAENPPVYDPATVFASEEITSSWQLPTLAGWQTTGSDPSRLELDGVREHWYRHKKESYFSQTSNAYWLATNGVKYNSMRERPADATPLQDRYEELISSNLQPNYPRVYPWLRLSPEFLPAILGLYPMYYDIDAWRSHLVRNAPQVTTKTVFDEAAGTQHDSNPRSSPPPQLEPSGFAKLSQFKTTTSRPDSVQPDDELVSTARQWVQAHGRQTSTTNPPHPRATFTCFRDRQAEHPVLVVNESSLHPGELIAATADANLINQQLLVLCDSEQTATTIKHILSHPFKQTAMPLEDQYGTHLYILPGPYYLDDNEWCIRPRTGTQPTWWLTPTNKLRLLLDGDTFESNQTAEHSRVELAANLPTCRYLEDDTYEIRDTTDTVVDEYPSKSELAESWAPLELPAIPNWIGTALETVTIRVRDGNHFRPPATHPLHISQDRSVPTVSDVDATTFKNVWMLPGGDMDSIQHSTAKDRYSTWATQLSNEPLELADQYRSLKPYLDSNPHENNGVEYIRWRYSPTTLL